ncbi:MAG: UbiA family prenyltransferase [Ardenticatenaceae bacterium]|nr:UbiA family prenyltransferase [Ardenticatenaceae bacterium]HBY95521.1 hypothetical protein [Chloroflexota bacterium]
MGIPASTAPGNVIRALLIHLRLHFQLLLAPIFLWGYVLAGGGPTVKGLAVFVAFHIFGYAGGTALNSYYDRDAGPIGGLVAPPPVVPALLPFSLAWQLLGFSVVLALNIRAALIYATMFWLSLGYSHPATRWKRRTWAALLIVAVGQGYLAFGAGWLTAQPAGTGLASPLAWLGASSAALLVTGFYPISQIYQVEEDRRRGDQTLAVRFGVRPALVGAGALSIVGLLGLVSAAAWRFGPADAVLLLLGYIGFGLWLFRPMRRLVTGQLAMLDQYRLVMRAALLNAAGLWLYLAVRLALNT